MGIEHGDELLLDGVPYRVTGHESEEGFGLDGEPKHWVKRAVDLSTQEKKIIKLVFFESFTQNVGDVPVLFYRSPRKEAAVLDTVRGHPHFMQGVSCLDAVGNNVRIIDRIKGVSLRRHILDLTADFEKYYHDLLPQILSELLACITSLGYLHQNGHVHGDVRWDHILFDQNSGLFRWIDFDYTYHFPEHPFGVDLFGLGNILAAVVGQGPISPYDLKNKSGFARRAGSIGADDFSPVDRCRLMNLREVYPLISKRLNRVLLHFSHRSPVFYESVNEITADLGDALSDLNKD
jgi:hypothetical protein